MDTRSVHLNRCRGLECEVHPKDNGPKTWKTSCLQRAGSLLRQSLAGVLRSRAACDFLATLRSAIDQFERKPVVLDISHLVRSKCTEHADIDPQFRKIQSVDEPGPSGSQFTRPHSESVGLNRGQRFLKHVRRCQVGSCRR